MITSWSPSKLTKYEECPLRCKLETVDKLCTICFGGAMEGWETQTCTKCGGSPVKGAALERGTLLHKAAEDYITGAQVGISEELKPVASWLVKYRLGYKKQKIRVEVELAVNRAWKPVEWFAKDAWLRTKIDVLNMGMKSAWEVIDWKTGKFKPDGEFSDQLNIYSTALLSAFVQPARVKSKLVFIDAGQDVERPEGEVKRKDLEKSQKRWEQRTKAMLSDEIFPPRPGNYCRWCPYSKARKGPCAY